MKLKNPDLHTSFSLTRSNKVFYIFSLSVVCSFENSNGKVYYHLFGDAYNYGIIHLGICFNSPEEAFTIADIICSEYPPFNDDMGFAVSEVYPEFDKEKFIK